MVILEKDSKMSDGLEIHSILEFGDEPVHGLWWVLSPSGESPPVRAGAALLIVKNEERGELDEKNRATRSPKKSITRRTTDRTMVRTGTRLIRRRRS